MRPAAISETSRVVALIPAYNEGARVAAVIEGAHRHLPVLVVDDGSSDDTALHAERTGATVLRQRPNQGKGAALRMGFRHALAEGVEAVLTLDADGQHDPAEIPAFLEARSTTGAELIIGARAFADMPFVRRVSNALGRHAFSWALGREVLDNQSGYRLIHRSLVEALLESGEMGYEFEVEMIVTCVERGMTLAWVPIRTIYGDERSHIDPIAHVIGFARLIGKTRRRLRGSARAQ